MPFDFKKYDAKCATLDGDALQREWEHYTRLISGAATSTAVSGAAIPFTLGVSTIGVGLAAPAIHNARKKREIIERHLQRLGRTHHTRKRDVLAASAISGTVGVVTLGLAPVGADAICNSAAEHGIAYIAENELGVKVVTHLALDAVAVAAEETHMHGRKEKEEWKAYAQAVREGKNPPLPNADHKISVTDSDPTFAFQVNHQNVPYPIAPSIQVVSPPEQMTPTGTGTPYFPPPPGQADLKVINSGQRRHSISTLSCNAQQTLIEPSQPQSNSHMLCGMTTAISAPMVGGQSYRVELTRPSSAMGEKPPVAQATEPASAIKYVSDEMTIFPPLPPPPPPPRSSQSKGVTVQEYQIRSEHPTAYSTTPFDGPPGSETQKEIQLSYSISQLSLSNLPPPVPPPAPMSPQSPAYTHPSPTPSHLSQYAPVQSTYTQQPHYSPYTRQTNAPTWSSQYGANDYVSLPPPPPPPQQQQQSIYHAPAQLVYSPQDWNYQPSDHKLPAVYQYQPQSPGTPLNGQPTHEMTGSPPSNYHYSPADTAEQRFQYMPPPPAYY